MLGEYQSTEDSAVSRQSNGFLKSLPTVFFKTGLYGLANIIFGVLYLLFSTDSSYYNECKFDSFIDWAYVNGLYQFLVLIAIFLFILQMEAFSNDHRFSKCSDYFLKFIAVGLLVLVIGLIILSDQSCGKLYTLNICYFWLCVIVVVVGVILFFLIASGMKKAYR